MLRVYVRETDRFDGKPLYEAIVGRCRELNIAGATVFRGIRGSGEPAENHYAHLPSHDIPVLITIVDSNDNVQRLLPELQSMIGGALILESDVTAYRT